VVSRVPVDKRHAALVDHPSSIARWGLALHRRHSDETVGHYTGEPGAGTLSGAASCSWSPSGTTAPPRLDLHLFSAVARKASRCAIAHNSGVTLVACLSSECRPALRRYCL
jgi:hypothetical protein